MARGSGAAQRTKTPRSAPPKSGEEIIVLMPSPKIELKGVLRRDADGTEWVTVRLGRDDIYTSASA